MNLLKIVGVLSVAALTLGGAQAPTTASSIAAIAPITQGAEAVSTPADEPELDEDGEAVPEIPQPLLNELHERGLEGEVTSVQEGENGGVFYGGEEGSWVISLDPEPTTDPAELGTPEMAAAAFSFGICSGSFNDIQKVSNYLQWGAQSSCTASNNQFYLHKVTVELHDTCVGIACLILGYIKTINSPSSSNYSRVATASGSDYCTDRSAGADRTYEQKVSVTVRSVQYGPFWQRDRVINDCDVSPG